MCRCQRHSVKPSCWECSTTVEQAETQLRVVVPIEEEEESQMTKSKKKSFDKEYQCLSSSLRNYKVTTTIL
jgi:hypothetical protein